MRSVHRRSGRGQAAVPPSAMLEFDQDTAEALAVVTLLASGRAGDVNLAQKVLDELLTAPDGARRVARGMASVSGGLLALNEFFSGVPASRALQELGRVIAQATDGDPRAC